MRCYPAMALLAIASSAAAQPLIDTVGSRKWTVGAAEVDVRGYTNGDLYLLMRLGKERVVISGGTGEEMALWASRRLNALPAADSLPPSAALHMPHQWRESWLLIAHLARPQRDSYALSVAQPVRYRALLDTVVYGVWLTVEELRDVLTAIYDIGSLAAEALAARTGATDICLVGAPVWLAPTDKRHPRYPPVQRATGNGGLVLAEVLTLADGTLAQAPRAVRHS